MCIHLKTNFHFPSLLPYFNRTSRTLNLSKPLTYEHYDNYGSLSLLDVNKLKFQLNCKSTTNYFGEILFAVFFFSVGLKVSSFLAIFVSVVIN